MLNAVSDFGALGVVETIQSAHQISSDATDPVEGARFFSPTASGTLVIDNSGVAALWIPVDGMVDSCLLYTSDAADE